jgi:hypothetical protein
MQTTTVEVWQNLRPGARPDDDARREFEQKHPNRKVVRVRWLSASPREAGGRWVELALDHELRTP